MALPGARFGIGRDLEEDIRKKKALLTPSLAQNSANAIHLFKKDLMPTAPTRGHHLNNVAR